MKTHEELRQDVTDELMFDPSLDEAGIGVAVTNGGVVTLTGHVGSYADKMAAEKAAKRVAGVNALANDLKVTLFAGTQRDDTDIAEAAVSALKWNTWLPTDAVKVVVKDGWITLEGTLDWQYQKDTARKAVEHLRGVKGVTNLVTLKPRVLPQEVEKKVQSAFARAATLDAKHVHAAAIGGRVVLSGDVRSWAEREDAERAAWSVTGVTEVDNNLTVGAMAYAEL
ncbi:MAG TPA: BON domain-containing protein [Longimicrobium sp.]